MIVIFIWSAIYPLAIAPKSMAASLRREFDSGNVIQLVFAILLLLPGVMVSVVEENLENKIFYVADAQISANNWMVLYRIENTVSKYTINSLIGRKCMQICSRLQKIQDCHFQIIHSFEITQREISGTFRKMSRQIRHAVFYQTNRVYPLCSIPKEEQKIELGKVKLSVLKDAVYTENGNPKQMVRSLFESPCIEERLDLCNSLMPLLNHLLREIGDMENISPTDGRKCCYTIEEIIEYYEKNFKRLHEQIVYRQVEGYTRLVQKMIYYIRYNYREEISLDTLGDSFQMNGVYLGQIFKKEVGIIFLKYLTNVRMEEAKRLLREENCTVSETAKRVGYQTSQYFGRIFARTVGMKPQEYKKCKDKK